MADMNKVNNAVFNNTIPTSTPANAASFENRLPNQSRTTHRDHRPRLPSAGNSYVQTPFGSNPAPSGLGWPASQNTNLGGGLAPTSISNTYNFGQATKPVYNFLEANASNCQRAAKPIYDMLQIAHATVREMESRVAWLEAILGSLGWTPKMLSDFGYPPARTQMMFNGATSYPGGAHAMPVPWQGMQPPGMQPPDMQRLPQANSTPRDPFDSRGIKRSSSSDHQHSQSMQAKKRRMMTTAAIDSNINASASNTAPGSSQGARQSVASDAAQPTPEQTNTPNALQHPQHAINVIAQSNAEQTSTPNPLQHPQHTTNITAQPNIEQTSTPNPSQSPQEAINVTAQPSVEHMEDSTEPQPNFQQLLALANTQMPQGQATPPPSVFNLGVRPNEPWFTLSDEEFQKLFGPNSRT